MTLTNITSHTSQEHVDGLCQAPSPLGLCLSSTPLFIPLYLPQLLSWAQQVGPFPRYALIMSAFHFCSLGGTMQVFQPTHTNNRPRLKMGTFCPVYLQHPGTLGAQICLTLPLLQSVPPTDPCRVS